MENYSKVTVDELRQFLMTVKYYRRCEFEYTAPLRPKMLVKDRVTKEPNALLNGFVNKLVNVNQLATTKEGMSGYQMRATNNGKGADYKPFQETYYELISPCVAKHKKYEKYYFVYERNLGSTKSVQYLLNGKKWLGSIGDVWKNKGENDRGVDIRLITLEHIDRISIEGLKLETIKQPPLSIAPLRKRMQINWSMLNSEYFLEHQF